MGRDAWRRQPEPHHGGSAAELGKAMQGPGCLAQEARQAQGRAVRCPHRCTSTFASACSLSKLSSRVCCCSASDLGPLPGSSARIMAGNIMYYVVVSLLAHISLVLVRESLLVVSVLVARCSTTLPRNHGIAISGNMITYCARYLPGYMGNGYALERRALA